MIRFILAFLLGVIILTMFKSLPHWQWIFGIVPAVLVGVRFPRCIVFVGLVSGFLWALCHAYLKLYPTLDEALEGVDLDVVGQIASIPSVRGYGTRFEFSIFSASRADDNKKIIVPKKIRLSWFDEVPTLQLGEQWQLRVRLKRPWGFANPGGFDYEKWLFEHGIRATGYVRNAELAKRIKTGGIEHPIYFLRARLHQQLQQASLGENSAVIQALTLGEKGAISSQHWKVLTGTGTNHLLAISGLHVGIVSGMIYLLVLRLWRLSEFLCLRIAAQRVAALAGIAACITYAMLAGFSIPTQRAMIMATVAFMAVYFGKSLRLWSLLSIALLIVLCWDPYSVLSPGFWLSFLAVVLIFFAVANKSTGRRSWLLRLGRMQWVLALGLLPLTLVFFQQAALISPIANFFAVPWVSFVVVPCVLFGSGLLAFSDSLAGWVLQGADYSIGIFWWLLSYLYEFPYAKWVHSTPSWALLPAAFGVLLLLSPKKCPGKALSLALLSPLVFAQSTPVQDDELMLTVLDVGQGLAVVMETKHRLLLYDTGPIYSSSFNAGESLIVPYLRERGVKKIDKLIVSHTDKDHSGGLHGILDNMQVTQLVTSTPDEFNHGDLSSCREGIAWEWDEAYFQFLHPDDDVYKFSRNDQSCVLLVTHSSGATALITGDIERPVEQILVENQADLLDTDVLIVPHHGSNSSSTAAFIQSTSPQYAVFVSGYRNPYGFPSEEVVSRYAALGAELVNTASQGMVTFTFSTQHGIQLRPGYRDVRRRFWHSNF